MRWDNCMAFTLAHISAKCKAQSAFPPSPIAMVLWPPLLLREQQPSGPGNTLVAISAPCCRSFLWRQNRQMGKNNLVSTDSLACSASGYTVACHPRIA